jgi:hypothetical protein
MAGPWSSIEMMLARFCCSAAAASFRSFLLLLRLRAAFRFFGGITTGAQALAAGSGDSCDYSFDSDDDYNLLSLKLGLLSGDACLMFCCFSLNISSKLFIFTD